MLYQMLAGHAPFRGSAADVITAHLRDPVPELPRELELSEVDVILRKAMAKEPDQRYSTASHFKSHVILGLSFIDAQECSTRNPDLRTGTLHQTSRHHLSESRSHCGQLIRYQSRKSLIPFSSAITEPHRLTSEFVSGCSK